MAKMTGDDGIFLDAIIGDHEIVEDTAYGFGDDVTLIHVEQGEVIGVEVDGEYRSGVYLANNYPRFLKQAEELVRDEIEWRAQQEYYEQTERYGDE